ncbi:MAG: hypothetical protein IKO62_08495 [Bacteroidales bacterium]|nr:hypothetical protein [Bacteroidales bacterium]
MKRFLLIIMLLGSLVGVGWAQVFVSSAGNDASDGSSWETAKRSISAGIAASGGTGTVFVKAGDYRTDAELQIASGVVVMGGFVQSSTGTDTSHRRRPGVNSHWADTTWCSVVSGAGNHRIATVNGLLDGFVLRNGYSPTYGGGLLIDGGIAQYCIIKECDAINDDDYDARGGGAHIRNNGILRNSVVTECRGDNGVGVSGENGDLINNTITRNSPISCGFVMDYDGNYYTTVQIGNQCWMRENLRTTHFANGMPITRSLTNSNEAPYYYHDNWTDELIAELGLLYNWNAVMHGEASSNAVPSGVQGICPNGWHVPSYSEWNEMINYVNDIPRYRCNNGNNQISKALATKTRWNGYYDYPCYVGNFVDRNNLTRFSAPPAGEYGSNRVQSFGAHAVYWTTTFYNNDRSYWASIRNGGQVELGDQYKSQGFSVRCIRDEDQEASNLQTIPTVTTAEVMNIAATTATCGGNVVTDGGASVTARGVCWSTSPNPTVSGSHTSDGAGVGEFTSAMTGLTPGLTYYVRAYATNSWGTAYGESRIFTMQHQSCPGAATLTDVDGNVYNTVQIGSQCWMKENLRVKHYADNGTEVEFLYPNNNSSTELTYGLLYTWDVMMHGANSSATNPSYVQGICPNGWHVPSRAEWEQLNSYLSSQSIYRCNNNADCIAKSMASKTEWANNGGTCNVGWEMNTNNTSGFSAMPTGYVNPDGNYYNFGYCIDWWASTISWGDYPIQFYIYYDRCNLTVGDCHKNHRLAVRCVKD